MEKTYKHVPFSIELAMKIQSGEVEGRIVNGFGRIARIICFDKKSDIYPVVALVKDGLSESSYESTYDFTKDGEILLGNSTNNDNLFIELPEKAPKHEFKPFDKVLVRENDASLWRTGFYSHELDGKHCVCGNYYPQCIPYAGNENLVGTTKTPE